MTLRGSYILPPCVGGCGRPLRTASQSIPGAVRHGAKGMCDACYRAASGKSTRATYARRRSVAREDVLEEWTALRGSTTPEEIARRIGMKPSAFACAMYRARRDGDPRAQSWRGMSTGIGASHLPMARIAA